MRAKTVVVLAISGLLIVACDWTGGGWMPGANGGKATVGFTGTCVDTDQGGGGGFTATAQDANSLTFSYVDKGVSPAVNIKGTAYEPTCEGFIYYQDFDPSGPCYTIASDCLQTSFDGEYRPAKGERGSYSMRFVDSGARGPSKGDLFSIELYGGKNDGYTNEQVLGGGNFKIRNVDSP